MPLQARQTGALGLGWTGTPGEHKINFILDPDNIIPETDETNNTASAVLTFPEPAATSTAEPHVDAWVELKDLLPLDAFSRARGELIVRTSGNGQIAVPVDVYDGDPAACAKEVDSFERILQAGASETYLISSERHAGRAHSGGRGRSRKRRSRDR